MPMPDTRAAGRRLVSATAMGFLLLTLTACTAYEFVFGEDPQPPCPTVEVLPEASILTRFRNGPGRDILDELYTGEIIDIGMLCEHDIDEDTQTGDLLMDLAVVVRAERGAANTDRKARLDYFVGITDATRGKILNKKILELPAVFPGNHTRITVTDDPIEMNFKLKKGQTGRDFSVVVGFQLNSDDMKFNQRRRAGKR